METSECEIWPSSNAAEEGEGNPSLKQTPLTPALMSAPFPAFPHFPATPTLYSTLNRQIRSVHIRLVDTNFNLERAANKPHTSLCTTDVHCPYLIYFHLCSNPSLSEKARSTVSIAHAAGVR